MSNPVILSLNQPNKKKFQKLPKYLIIHKFGPIKPRHVHESLLKGQILTSPDLFLIRHLF